MKGEVFQAAVSCVLVGAMTCSQQTSELILKARKLAPELFRTAPEMSAAEGYAMETHTVQTADGYRITLHRLPWRRGATPRGPVFLQHGVLQLSDYWLSLGRNNSLPYLLVDRGYDVWIGNARGNVYSRKHVTLKPTDPEFWNFSWHEMGVYDLPAVLDHVLATTGHRRLYYVGYSMGSTMAYVLLSTRPEYNSKIRIIVSLAPGIYGHHTRSNLTLDFVRKRQEVKTLLRTMRKYEALPMTDSRTAFLYFLCRDGSSAQAACQQLIFQIGGVSSGLNKTLLPLFVSRLAGTSYTTVDHFLQIVQSGKFEQRDLGPELNQQLYGSREPLEYDLRHLTVPVEIHTSSGDDLVPSVDVKLLLRRLRNVVGLRMVPAGDFNHFDFLTHVRVRSLLYDHVLGTLERY